MKWNSLHVLPILILFAIAQNSAPAQDLKVAVIPKGTTQCVLESS